MSDIDARMPARLHRDWACECVGIRAPDSRGLAAALRAAAGRAADICAAKADFACVAWAAAAVPGNGLASAAVIADSAEALVERLRQAADAVDRGMAEAGENGIYVENRPRASEERVAWLFGGAEQVTPGMLGELGLLLPGFIQALDEAVQGDAEPGRLVDYLYGPGDPPSLDATGRARLAIGAARAMTEWLLRLMPRPWRAVGGPGGVLPWLDTTDLAPAVFSTCSLSEVAASGDWAPLLQRLRDEGVTRCVYIGPGAFVAEEPDMVSLRPETASELGGLLQGLARLIAVGVPVNLHPLYAARGLCETPAETPARRRGAPTVFQPRSPRFDVRAVTPPAGASPPPASPIESSVPPKDPRSSVVLEHLQTMQLFLEQQQRAVHSIMGREGPVAQQAPPPSPPAAPMLDRVLECRPGRRLVASARYDVFEASFLRQHTPNVSAVSSLDRAAFGLPAMPLTFSMEILAEAAAELVPGCVVTGFEELVAERWMTFENDAIEVVVEAEVVGQGPGITVGTILRSAQDANLVYLRGRVLLDPTYPRAPVSEPLLIPGGSACGWDLDDIYPRCGFHGPMLQAITAVDDHGDSGMTGELTVLPRSHLFASNPSPAFCLDPVLLDALGTGLGVWMWPEADNGVYPVPFKVARIRFYGPPCPEGERLRMEIRLNQRDALLLDADLTAVRTDGTPYVQVSGWQDYVYRLPLSIHRIMSDPFGQLIAESQPWIQGTPGWSDVVVATFPVLGSGFLDAGDGVWEKILAWYGLAPAERRQWLSMADQAQRRRSWLMGRIAVKDAVRGLLRTHQIIAGHYDVHIDKAPEGSPQARGPWADTLPEGIAVSLAHAGDAALAVAGNRERGTLGIDIEHPSSMNEEVAECTFSRSDRDQLKGLGGDDPTRLTHGWCAKEAVAKALGIGLRHDPRALVITGVGTAPPVIRIAFTGPWAADGNAARSDVDVYLFTHREHAVALCRIP